MVKVERAVPSALLSGPSHRLAAASQSTFITYHLSLLTNRTDPKPDDEIHSRAPNAQTALITASCKFRQDRCRLRCSFLLQSRCNSQAPSSPKSLILADW